MTGSRAPRESVVELGRPTTGAGALRVAACWTLLVVGVVLIPALCLFWALITGMSIEPTTSSPESSAHALAWVWAARVIATLSAGVVLALSIVVTARGGRLVNGWIVVVLSLPVIALLWLLQVH
jgi:hypothetical protein